MSETPIQDRLDQLIADQAEGTLTSADAREMAKALDASPDAVHRAAISILVHRLLRHFASPSVDADKIMRALPLRPNTLISSTVADSRNNKPIIWLRWLALAASLAIVAGGVWLSLRSTGALGLRVAEVQGSGVRVQGSVQSAENIQQPTSNNQHPNGEGTAVKVVVGMKIRQGDRVVVKEGKVGLKYDGEATTIELLAATEAGFGADKGAKRVTLTAGKLVCSAAPQKMPLEIATRQAVSRVVGTRFSLTAEDVKTTLAVLEGKVDLCQGEKVLEVKSGETATATDEGVKMEVVSQAQELSQCGSIWAWVWIMGDEKSDDNFTPVQVAAVDGTPFSSVTAIAAGGDHTAGVALKSDGSVWNWGLKEKNGKLTDPLNPVPVKMADGTPFADVTAIAAGVGHTVALRKDRTVWVWGANSNGELGDGMTLPRQNPVQIRNLSDVTAIAANHNYTLALRADGTVWIWGYRMDTTVQSAATSGGHRTSGPVQVRQRDGNVLSEVTAISAGFNHAVALKKDGSVWTWGDNSCGELGDGTQKNGIGGAVQARLADGSALRDVAAISGGHVHTVALKSDGSVWAWGRLGDAGELERQSTPVQVVAADGTTFNVAAITAGYLPYRFLAVTRDGACWGWTGEQICLSDNGKKTLQVRPTRIQELANVISVVDGAGYTMALAK